MTGMAVSISSSAQKDILEALIIGRDAKAQRLESMKPVKALYQCITDIESEKLRGLCLFVYVFFSFIALLFLFDVTVMGIRKCVEAGKKRRLEKDIAKINAQIKKLNPDGIEVPRLDRALSNPLSDPKAQDRLFMRTLLPEMIDQLKKMRIVRNPRMKNAKQAAVALFKINAEKRKNALIDKFKGSTTEETRERLSKAGDEYIDQRIFMYKHLSALKASIYKITPSAKSLSEDDLKQGAQLYKAAILKVKATKPHIKKIKEEQEEYSAYVDNWYDDIIARGEVRLMFTGKWDAATKQTIKLLGVGREKIEAFLKAVDDVYDKMKNDRDDPVFQEEIRLWFTNFKDQTIFSNVIFPKLEREHRERVRYISDLPIEAKEKLSRQQIKDLNRGVAIKSLEEFRSDMVQKYRKEGYSFGVIKLVDKKIGRWIKGTKSQQQRDASRRRRVSNAELDALADGFVTDEEHESVKSPRRALSPSRIEELAKEREERYEAARMIQRFYWNHIKPKVERHLLRINTRAHGLAQWGARRDLLGG